MWGRFKGLSWPFCCLGVYLGQYTTAFQTQRPLHTSKTLLCIRNARHLIGSKLLLKWPLEEPFRGPHQLMIALRPCQGGRCGERATCYFQALGLAGDQSPSGQGTRSHFQNRSVQSWQMRGSLLPPLNLVSALALAEALAQERGSLRVLVSHRLSNEMTCTTICSVPYESVCALLTLFLRATLKSGPGASIHGGVSRDPGNH